MNGHSSAGSPEEHVAQPSVEPAQTNGVHADARPQSSASKSGAQDLPLYQPPAPVSQSPELSKRQPALTNAFSHGSPSAAQSNGVKRKRDSSASITASAKKAKMSFAGGPEQVIAEEADVDEKSLELARSLQQEDRGLRRRSQVS